jgi:tetratricopeptide (TPR) repeat protein
MTASGNNGGQNHRAKRLSATTDNVREKLPWLQLKLSGTLGMLVLLLCAAFALHVALASFRVWWASGSITAENVSVIDRAISLEPDNAEHYYQRGRQQFLREFNIDGARQSFERAVAINPYVARYWFELSEVSEASGDATGAKHAIDRAVAADPNTPSVAWEAAQFYLLHGENDKALRQFKVVLGSEPGAFREVLELSWRITGDPDKILSLAMFPSVDAHIAFLNLLVEKEETDACTVVWKHLVRLNQQIQAKSTFYYLDHLVRKGRTAELVNAWNDLARLDRSIPPQTIDNAVVNGSFEAPVINGGLGWRYSPSDAVTLQAQSQISHSGARAMAFLFKGPALNDAGLYHYVPVEPGEAYEVSAWVRSENLESASGPRIALADAVTNAPVFATKDVIGSNQWQPLTGAFTVPDSTSLLVLRINRADGSKLIKGNFWLDDVRVTRSVQ